ncbi:MAG: tetratricopeptide repeat protein [Proteobacteria bacterium]|nr:tetratricopeptide repeat protein [Pseudomonadota bacterium]MBU4355907.1 tetratricopeptide repeat protein [Pseudomonadota bacterium]
MPRGWPLWLVLLLMVLLAAPAGGEGTPEEEARRLNQQAVELYQARRYQEALPLQQRALEIYEKALGPEHPDTCTSLNNLAGLYQAMGAFDQALPLYQRTLKIREKALGLEHIDTANSLNNLAALYWAMAIYDQALPLYQRALKIREKALGPEHPDTSVSLNNLATLYQSMGAYGQALPLFQQALAIREKVLGPEHPATAVSLSNLAGLYVDQGAYAKAVPLYQRSLQIVEKALGPEHPRTATSLNNLALQYKALGAYDQALPRFQRALKILEKALGPEHPDTAVSLNNLAALYEAQGAYDQALPLYQRALQIREKALGPWHPDTASGLNNLAGMYETLGAYDQALPLYQRALGIYEKALGPEHPETATGLNNLARLYQAMGAYEKALPLYQRALAFREKALGPEHPAIAISLSSLAVLYEDLGAYDQALPLQQRALKIHEKAVGPEHPDTASSLNNLAVLYKDLGAYDQALPLYRRALKIRKKVLGPTHPDTANSLNNLAMLYQVMGSDEQALPLYQRSLQIIEKSLGPEHPNAVVAVSNLGALYLDRKDYQTAEAYFRRGRSTGGLVELDLARGQPGKALKLLQENTPTWRDFPTKQVQYYTQRGLALAGEGRLGEAALDLRQAVDGVEDLRRRAPGERAGFFQAGIYGGYVRPYRGLVTVLGEMSLKSEALPPALREYGPGAGEAAFYFAESTKGRALLEAMAQGARQQTRAEIPAELRQREESLLNRLVALSAQREKALKGGEAAIKEVEDKKARLTAELKTLVQELRQHYPVYAALHYPQPLPAADLPLKENEVLLAFALGDAESFVFVVRKGGVKHLIKIPQGREELEAKVKAFMEPLINREPDRFSLPRAQELYSLLLAQALKEVKENDRVIIVPDGILGLLPFEALVLKSGTGLKDSVFIGDRYTLSYYQSAAVMALKRRLKEHRAGRPLFALGNPVFSAQDARWAPGPPPGAPPSTEVRGAKPAAFRALAASEEWGKTTRDGKTGEELVYPALPETEDEVLAIARLFAVEPRPPDVLLDLKANETSLRQSPLQDYRYLHFATHADLPGRVQGIREPFLLLGQVGNEGHDNGFFTLSKVLGLKLRAEMVVLSACLTGRGTVMEGEGVVNFSRAFQHAGAQSVLVSLWEVASLEAVEFMTRFYSHLKEGKPRSEALRLARLAIKAKYPQPFFWAVFILHGEG